MAIVQGSRILASDINSLVFFPIGTILTVDGTVTSNNSGCVVNGQKLDGWYICNATNRATGRTPDLTNKFIRGAETSGLTGGSNTQNVYLTAAHLPSHYHSISDSGHSHNISLGSRHGAHGSANSPAWSNGDVGSSATTTTTSSNNSSNITATDSAGSGQPISITTTPEYYTLIYIKRVN